MSLRGSHDRGPVTDLIILRKHRFVRHFRAFVADKSAFPSSMLPSGIVLATKQANSKHRLQLPLDEIMGGFSTAEDLPGISVAGSLVRSNSLMSVVI